MSKRLPIAALLVAALPVAAALWPALAAAQGPCAAREAIVARLAERFGEVQTDGAAAGGLSFYEVFASARTGTWTVLLTGTNGISCIVAAGEGWRPAANVASRLRGVEAGTARVR